MLRKDYSLTTQVKMVVGIGGLHWGNKGELANIIMLPPLQSIPVAPMMIFIELLKPPSVMTVIDICVPVIGSPCFLVLEGGKAA